MKRILLGTLFAAASFNAFADAPGGAGCGWVRESEINQKGKARKLWDIEEGKGI
ncbi:TPA: hypothetical protein P6M78_002043 [Pseudomonas aeruginosa]|nr:hypothetical protein [Pseudomonas aeruginosa]HDP3697062.1 hypothetical protein [Pseudomonas aeruginosa]